MKYFFSKTKHLIWLFVFIFQLLCSNSLEAQIILKNPSDYSHLPGTTFSASCPGTGCTITLPKARLNQLYEITIPISSTLPVDSFNISNVTGCTEILNNYSISNTDNTINLQVTQRCPTSVSSNLSFILNAYYNSSVEPQPFIVPIIRDTAKLVLTLDVSGSMILPVQGGSGSRIDALKDAVNMLVPKLVDFGQAGDSLSLTYFSSTVIKDSPISKGFKLIETSPTNIIDTVTNDLTPRTPLQMTALGEGLLDAKNKLKLDNTPNLNRNVFLFTDGLQNYGNKVKDDGMSFFLTNDSLNNYSTNPKDSIKYFPVATWASGDEPERLQNIAKESNGEVIFVTPNTNLIIWFNLQLANMLESGSPQLVINRSFNISDENTISFNLNEHITKLLIELTTEDAINMSILKGTVPMDSKAKVRSGDNYTVLTYEFPIIDNPVVNSGGEWTIKFEGESPKPVNLTVIADDHFLKYNCTSNKELYTVGDTLHLKTTISHINGPVTTSGNTVTAIVLKPGEDLGDLLANTATPELNDSVDDIESGAAQKFNELMMNDSSFFNALLPKEQIINLTDAGNGEFTGYFKETELAGIYNIIYLMDGEIVNFGNFKRTKTISTVFVFGQIVEEEPEVVEDAPPASTGSNKGFTVLRIRPKNKFGKYMGPGFMSKIKFNVNPKLVKAHKTSMTQETENVRTPFLSEIKDNLDGSYYLYIANLEDTEKWDFSITVRDEVLHDYATTMPWWVYLIVFLLLLLIYLFKKSGKTKILMWVLLGVWLIVIILHYLGYLNFL